MHSKPIRIVNLPWREVDGNIVILSPKTSAIHELNGVASFLWKAADGSRDRKEILAQLIRDYAVDEKVAAEDAEVFFASLEELKLIRWENAN